jgi:ABC-type branched-subunit amino acid transport system permease subunit
MTKQSAPESKPVDPKVKARKLMRFWVFGTFIISAGAVSAYAGVITGFLIFREPLYWLIIGVCLVASVLVLLVHEWYLRRK